MHNHQTYPLSIIEKRMLDLNMRRPDADILNRPLRIFGPLCINTFLGAYQWLTEKYTVMKTRYKKDELSDSFVKVLDHPAVITFEDYSAKSKEALEQKLEEISRSVFDVQKDPLFKMFLIKSNENENIFFIKCHHISADGISCLKLVHGVFEAYNFNRTTGNYPTIDSEYGMPDFVKFEEEFLQTKKGMESNKYWTDILDKQKRDSTIKNIPKSIESHSVDLLINEEEYTTLERSVQSMDVSTFAYTTAAFQKVLAPDMLVSTTISTRIQKAHRKAIGPMFKYALLGQGPENEPFKDKALRLRKEIFRAQRTPYCCDTIALHGNPNYAFDYEKTALATYFKIAPENKGFSALAFGGGSSEPTPMTPELGVKPVDLPLRFVPYSLFLSIGDFQTNLHLKLIYNIELYTKQEAHEILQVLKNKLLDPNL